MPIKSLLANHVSVPRWRCGRRLFVSISDVSPEWVEISGCLWQSIGCLVLNNNLGLVRAKLVLWTFYCPLEAKDILSIIHVSSGEYHIPLLRTRTFKRGQNQASLGSHQCHRNSYVPVTPE